MTEPPMYILCEHELRHAMEDVGVQNVRRWHCPCGVSTCETFVLFGVGHAKNEHVRLRGDAPPNADTRVLWVACSFTFATDHKLYMGGISLDESVEDMLLMWGNGDEPRRHQAGFLSFLCALGLAQELDIELKEMRAS